MNEARQDDVVIAVACCDGPRYVRVSHRATWRCGRCGSNGSDRGEDSSVVLGHNGALPDPERGTTPHIRGAVRSTSTGVSSGAAPALA